MGYDAQFVSGDQVAVVGSDGAQIIDPRSREMTQRFAVGADATRLAVDSTGRLLATVDGTGSIQLWDSDTVVKIGEALRPPSGTSSTPIRFSADGRYLLVSGPVETMWINVRTADWRPIACSLVTDVLSSAERAQFLGSLETSELCP